MRGPRDALNIRLATTPMPQRVQIDARRSATPAQCDGRGVGEADHLFTRVIAGCVGFLTLIQLGDVPVR
jgi:hypothetical protein